MGALELVSWRAEAGGGGQVYCPVGSRSTGPGCVVPGFYMFRVVRQS